MHLVTLEPSIFFVFREKSRKAVRKMMWKALLIVVLAFSHCQAVLETDANTLVLLDNLAIRETHSIFFKSLQGKMKTPANL